MPTQVTYVGDQDHEEDAQGEHGHDLAQRVDIVVQRPIDINEAENAEQLYEFTARVVDYSSCRLKGARQPLGRRVAWQHAPGAQGLNNACKQMNSTAVVRERGVDGRRLAVIEASPPDEDVEDVK